MLEDKHKQVQASVNKLNKFDEMKTKISDIQMQYQDKINELLLRQKDLEQQQNQQLIKYQELSKKYEQQALQLSEQSHAIEKLENDNKLKVAEINRLKLEKDSIKRQSSNLGSLLKQVNEEKEVTSQKMHELVDDKLQMLKTELQKVKETYQQKLIEKDNRLQQLERELKLQKKENELNQEFTFLQSSFGNSLLQSKSGTTPSKEPGAINASELQKSSGLKISPIKQVTFSPSVKDNAKNN